ELLAWPPLAEIARYDEGFRAQVALKRATSELVERFAAAAVAATWAATGRTAATQSGPPEAGPSGTGPSGTGPSGAGRDGPGGGAALARYDADLVVPRVA